MRVACGLVQHSDLLPSPVYVVPIGALDDISSYLPQAIFEGLRAIRFEPKLKAMVVLPLPDSTRAVVFCPGFTLDETGEVTGFGTLCLSRFGALARQLPSGLYTLANIVFSKTAHTGISKQNTFLLDEEAYSHLLLSFALGRYKFQRYLSQKLERAELLISSEFDMSRIDGVIEAIYFGRDLINIPALDLGPDHLKDSIKSLADRYGGTFKAIRGKALQAEAPMVHGVGMASDREPLLVDTVFQAGQPFKLTLVGKGVCFDTGGLGIKPASGMRNMKKDMGGAATAIALAMMILDAKLPVELRLIIPAVDNAIAGNAFRPGDVLIARNGASVEIGHTDAEGRLILADALVMASEGQPDLILDFATLTGAARVALGAEVIPFYTRDQSLSLAFKTQADKHFDPLWEMPLWDNYSPLLASKVADFGNVTTDGKAGSIIAALFLQKFVAEPSSWAHFDVYGWRDKDDDIGVEGGEIQAARAVFHALESIVSVDRDPSI